MDGRLLQEALAEARAAFVAALTGGGDATAAAALYAEDARLLPPVAAPMHGREAIEAFWRAGLDAGITAVEFEATEIEGDDRLAYELGRYELRLQPGNGGGVVERGSYLLVHALQSDGSWRRAAEMFSPDGPPTALGGRQQKEGRTHAQVQTAT